MPVIKLSNIKKRFGSKKVLNGLNLSVDKGESLVILGASGTGKSVCLKIILGLEKPNSGTVEKATDNIGMLFQNGALFDSLQVWENIAFSLINNDHIDEESAKKIAIQRLADVGLPASTATLMPADLSGGMKKRVSLARAITANPEIIFFDEPTTGLDPLMSEVINNLIIKSVNKLGATAITITHDIHSALSIASRIVMLDEGRIIWDGNPAELLNSHTPYVKRFVSASGLK